MDKKLEELKSRDEAKKVQNGKLYKDFHGQAYKATGTCPVCGHDVQGSMNFCDKCGQRLNWKSVTYNPMIEGKKQICRDMNIPFYLNCENGFEKVYTISELEDFFENQVDEEQKKSGTDFEKWLYDCRKAGLLMLGK